MDWIITGFLFFIGTALAKLVLFLVALGLLIAAATIGHLWYKYHG